ASKLPRLVLFNRVQLNSACIASCHGLCAAASSNIKAVPFQPSSILRVQVSLHEF
ncbi:hypothetical protein Tco_0346825, partial [Tanacetum coccineum]